MEVIEDAAALLAAATTAAEEQEGVVSRAQLLEIGLTDHRIENWLRSGRLRRLFEDVYTFGHRALRARAWWRAALLACGEDAVLSHLAAAYLHELRLTARGPIDVTTPRSVHGQRHLRVHRTRRLAEADVTEVDGIRVTSIARTLLDLGDTLSYREVRTLADEPKQLDVEALVQTMARNPGRHGAKHLKRFVAREEAHTRSAFERRYVRFCSRRGLPAGDERNVRVGRHLVDVLYETHATAIELDGRAFHARRGQMRRDRRRDVDLLVAGYKPGRFVWEDFDDDEAEDTERRIRQLLAAEVGGVRLNPR